VGGRQDCAAHARGGILGVAPKIQFNDSTHGGPLGANRLIQRSHRPKTAPYNPPTATMNYARALPL
jgi:hypothetical protein